MFSCDTSDARLMYVRIKPGVRADEALAKMAAVMKKDNPAYPFQYAFVDETFAQFFTSETLLGVLSRLFAVLAILISCLGLFGLSAYTAERRTKEIGIRKVLGASVTGITGLLSREFLLLVALSGADRFPDRLVGDEPLAAAVCLPGGNRVVDIYRCDGRGDGDCADHDQFSVGACGVDESGEEPEGGVMLRAFRVIWPGNRKDLSWGCYVKQYYAF